MRCFPTPAAPTPSYVHRMARWHAESVHALTIGAALPTVTRVQKVACLLRLPSALPSVHLAMVQAHEQLGVIQLNILRKKKTQIHKIDHNKGEVAERLPIICANNNTPKTQLTAYIRTVQITGVRVITCLGRPRNSKYATTQMVNTMVHNNKTPLVVTSPRVEGFWVSNS